MPSDLIASITINTCNNLFFSSSLSSSLEQQQEQSSSNTNHNNNNDHDTIAKSTSSSSSNNKYDGIPVGVLGPPDPIRQLKIGQRLHQSRDITTVMKDNKEESFAKSQQQHFTVERVSYTPDIFVLRNFLSKEECNNIIEQANESKMTNAETITNANTEARKNCQVAWLPSAPYSHNNNNLISKLVSSTAYLFLSKYVTTSPHSENTQVEDLQVLKYGVGGEFILHHDGEPRLLTIIYYVNGVGGTWFPFARTSEEDDSNGDPCKDMNDEEIYQQFIQTRDDSSKSSKDQTKKEKKNKSRMDFGKNLSPGIHGVLIKGVHHNNGNQNSSNESDNDNSTVRAVPKQQPSQKHDKHDDSNNNIDNNNVVCINCGDAVAFYNYKDDGSGRLDWKAVHTGLPTTKEDGTKWIANHWFRFDCLSSK